MNLQTVKGWCLCLIRQSCPTLCNPLDCSPPGYPVHWIFHTRILEWVASSSSRGHSQPKNQTCLSFVSCFAGRFFTRWAIVEVHSSKAGSYFTSKMGLLGIVEKLQFRICKPWQNHGPVPHTTERNITL